MRECSFSQPVNLRVAAASVDARSTSFERGVDLVLSSGAQLSLAGASIGGPSLLTTDPDASTPARLTSLDGARLSKLTLRGLDLQGCAFVRAHALDEVAIGGRGQLPRSPKHWPWTGRRETLSDEYDLRFAYDVTVRPFTQSDWERERRPPNVSADPATLAETYRALRRGREQASDRPGASDFYYGEMEMRRLAASGTERLILQAYWLLAGYGLRASRALVAYGCGVVAMTLLLLAWGLKTTQSVGQVLAHVLGTTTVLAKVDDDVQLNTFGLYVQIAARLLGPALFALMVLAVRARVRR